MKKINIKFIGALLLMLLVLGSCKKWIDTGINKNPDAPLDAPLSTILPSIQVNMAYNTVGGNDYARITSIWMQQVHGVARQSVAQTNYLLRDGDVSNQWATNYAGVMMDIKQMVDKATTANQMYYKGIGEVLMANCLGITTDVWNDIPYMEAFKGVDQMQPPFDTQESVYTSILTLLDNAIADLGQPNTNSRYKVTGDLMFNGSAAKWIKAAYALKARYQLHLCKRDGNAWANALATLGNGAMASNSDDLQFNFLDIYSQSNPLFLFMDNRGDIVMDSVFVKMLSDRLDPRISAYCQNIGPDTLPTYVGAGWGWQGETVSNPGPAVSSMSSPVYFMTYAECLFIKAECEFKTGAVAESQIKADLLDAVTASLKKYDVYNPAYIAGYDTLYLKFLTGDLLYKEIMVQKYIALFYQGEVFNDWRRTENVMGLVANPTGNAVRNEIPRRFPYSSDEKNYNSNTPTVASIWERVWWDKAPGGEK